MSQRSETTSSPAMTGGPAMVSGLESGAPKLPSAETAWTTKVYAPEASVGENESVTPKVGNEGAETSGSPAGTIQ